MDHKAKSTYFRSRYAQVNVPFLHSFVQTCASNDNCLILHQIHGAGSEFVMVHIYLFGCYNLDRVDVRM